MSDVQSRHYWPALPKCIITDLDPLFRFHRWLANLRVLEIKEIKSDPRADLASVH